MRSSSRAAHRRLGSTVTALALFASHDAAPRLLHVSQLLQQLALVVQALQRAAGGQEGALQLSLARQAGAHQVGLWEGNQQGGAACYRPPGQQELHTVGLWSQ